MNKTFIASELLKAAKELTAADEVLEALQMAEFLTNELRMNGELRKDDIRNIKKIHSDMQSAIKKYLKSKKARSMSARATMRQLTEFIKENKNAIEDLVDAALEKIKENTQDDGYVNITEVSTDTESDDYGPYTVGYYEVASGIDDFEVVIQTWSLIEIVDLVEQNLEKAYRDGDFEFADLVDDEDDDRQVHAYWKDIEGELVNSRSLRKVVGDYLRKWGAVEDVEVMLKYNEDEIGTTYIDGYFKNGKIVWKADIEQDKWLEILTERLGDTYKSTGVNTGNRSRD